PTVAAKKPVSILMSVLFSVIASVLERLDTTADPAAIVSVLSLEVSLPKASTPAERVTEAAPGATTANRPTVKSASAVSKYGAVAGRMSTSVSSPNPPRYTPSLGAYVVPMVTVDGESTASNIRTLMLLPMPPRVSSVTSPVLANDDSDWSPR